MAVSLHIKLEIIRTYVNKVYCYPLAIKWVLGQVAIGKDINLIINNINDGSSDIAKFCFERIYDDLEKNDRIILCALSMLEDKVQAGVLKYITNLQENDFSDSIKKLVRLSLVISDAAVTNPQNQELRSVFSLLPLTRGFVKKRLDADPCLKNILQDRRILIDNLEDEVTRARKQYKYSLSNYGATTQEEKIAVVYLSAGFQKSQTGDYPGAVTLYDKAREIAPKFAPVYRNYAILEADQFHWVEADQLMKKATLLAPNDTQVWFVWGNIKRKNDKTKEALKYYMKAKELSPNDSVILNALGQTLTRLGEYEKANELFDEALTSMGEDSSSYKHLIINHTSIADNLKRWAEKCITNGDKEDGINKLNEALTHINETLKLNRNDEKSITIYKEIKTKLGYAYRDSIKYRDAILCFKDVLQYESIRVKDYEKDAKALIQIINCCILNDDMDTAKSVIANKEYVKVIKKQ